MILVIGAGAVGTFLGWTLARGGEDVQLLRRNRPAGVQRETVSVAWPADPALPIELAVAGSPGAVESVPDLILVAVRMPDLVGAIETAGAWPDAAILAVENGVGADDLLRSGRPSCGLLAGSLTTSVERAGDGAIRRLSRGGIVLAPVRGDVGGVTRRLVNAFVKGGLRARATTNPAALRWSKLLINLMGNATGAIVDMDPVVVYRNHDLFGVERAQMAEALATMTGLGLRPIKLFGADTRLLPLAARMPGPVVQPILVRVVAAGRGGKRPSLHLHLEAGGGGPSEVAWLNGAVVGAALKLGRTAPVNARLAELVEACNQDPDRRSWFRGRPERLLEAVAGP